MNQPVRRTAAPDAEPDPRRWFVLAVCLSALFMTLLDATIVNVSLPSIRTSLGADAAQQQWVVSGYALAFGVVPILGGRLGDDRGRRPMLLIGIAGFVLTSLLAGLATGPSVLLVARVLQGLSGGLVNPQVSGLVQQLFPRPERGRAFGLLGMNVGLAQAIGPVLGGLIIAIGGTQLGWRLTFLINVPVGATAFVLAWRMLPREQPTATPRRLDLPGVGLLTLGLAGVLFPVVEYDADRDLGRLVIIAPALAVVAAFVWWERGPARRRGYPLIDTGLFRVRSYSAGLSLALLYFAGFTGTSLVLSLFLQNGLGFSALQSGLTASSLAVGLALGARVASRFVNRAGRKVLVVALATFAVGIAGAALTVRLGAGQLAGATLAWSLVPWLFVAGFGGGSVITPNQALSLTEVDVAGGSTAGGMLQTSQRVGAAVGAAVLSAVFYGRLAGGGPTHGSARAAYYGAAYSAALVVTVVLALAALALAVRETRRAPNAAPELTPPSAERSGVESVTIPASRGYRGSTTCAIYDNPDRRHRGRTRMTSRPSGDRNQRPDSPEAIWAELSRAQRSLILEALGIDPAATPADAPEADEQLPDLSPAASDTMRSLAAGIDELSPAVSRAPTRFVDRAATTAAAQHWAPGSGADRIVASNFDPALIRGGAAAATGSLACQLVHVPAGEPIRAVLLDVVEPGAQLHAGSNLVAVYELDGRRLGMSADQAGTWATHGRKHMPLRPTVRARPYARTVYVCFVSAGRPGPSFGAAGRPLPTGRARDERGLRVAGRLTGQLTCPPRIPLADMREGRQFWVGLA